MKKNEQILQTILQIWTFLLVETEIGASSIFF